MANPETQIVLGITMFEDVFLAVYLSLISGIVLSGATSFTGVASSGGIALGFIVGLIIIGRWATPLLNRAFRISSSELFVVMVFASLFLLAGLGETIHVAESIGALLLDARPAAVCGPLRIDSSECFSAAGERVRAHLRFVCEAFPAASQEEESRGRSRRSRSMIAETLHRRTIKL